jgi:ElaB/YqjD/DUF883 family membrane-anchored ribosome-binding protein
MQQEPTGPAGTPRSGNRSEFAERVAEKGHSAVDDLADRVETAERKIGDAGHRVSAKTRAAKDSAQSEFSEYQRRVEVYAREHPYTALGVAFAAGLIAAALLRR